MALVLPIIGFTALMGAFLNSDEKYTERKNVSIRNDVLDNDIPNGTNIYSSDMVRQAELATLKAATDNYNAAKDPAQSNVLPPLFNTYSINGNVNILTTTGNTLSSNLDLNTINETNRRLNVLETKQTPSITSRPMFNPIISNDEDSHYILSDFNKEKSIVNPLTGLPYETNHNNQTPFFGGSVKQNVENLTNVSKLDMYTGRKDTFIHKKEQNPFFPQVQQDINGTPMLTLNVSMDRYIPSNFKQSEKPFNEQRVYAEKAGTIDNSIRETPKTVDELRVLSRPKLSYEARTQSGQFGSVRGVQAAVNKNKVDTYYENTPDRWNKTPGAVIVDASRENFQTNFKETNRQHVSDISYYGPGQSIHSKEYQKVSRANGTTSNFDSIVQEPSRQSLYTDNVRNITSLVRTDDKHDHGRSGYRVYDTERHVTGETNNFNINVNMQDKGNKIYLQDDAKTTNRELTSINKTKGHIKTIFDKGSMSAYDEGVQNWDAKTTNKEMHVNNKYIGVADKNEGMGYSIANYQARTTGKESITENSNYIGNNGNGVIKTTMSRFNYNQAEINDRKEILVSNNRASGPNKYQISSGVDSQGSIKYTNRMMLKEDENHRNTQNVNEFLNPHVPKSISQIDQIGLFKHRKQETISDRLAPSMILTQLQNNPLVINGPNRI